MDRIPKEVLGLIFSFLSERFRRYIEVTCKEWTNLIRNEPHIISSKIRDIIQYFPNSDFPSLDKVKDIGIVVNPDMPDYDLPKDNIKTRIYINLPTIKRRNEYICYLKHLSECKLIKILKYKCFLCNGLSKYDHVDQCVLCQRYIPNCCYNRILEKTCGFIQAREKKIRLKEYRDYVNVYCTDCIDVAVATKKVVTCKKCNGYFDLSNKPKNCKDCGGIFSPCYLKRCVKCRQAVCKTCNPCEPIPFCNKCLYMCTTCKKFSENLVRCKKCKITRYCSEECQAVDLDKHTKTCDIVGNRIIDR